MDLWIAKNSGKPPTRSVPRSSVAAGQFDLSHAAFVFRGTDFAGNRVADFFEAGEIPEVGKLAALLRLDRLDRTVVALQENAGAVRLPLQRQPAPIPAQPGEL